MTGPDFISQGPVPSMRVRACWGEGGPDGGLYVHLRDLMDYVSYPHHRVDAHCRDAIESLLVQLGVALESD